MNILLLSHRFYPDVGGIETTSHLFATNFTEAGHVVHIMTWSVDESKTAFPFTVIRNPTLTILFQQHKWADVIFENNPCLRLVWPSIFFKRASVIALHTWISRIDGKIGWQDHLKSLWLKRATTVIACSHAIRNGCWPTAFVIENPYRESLFRIKPTIPRNKSFIFLGRLVSDKGVDLAITAIDALISDPGNSLNSSDLTLTIVGNGPERLTLETLVSELGIQDRINFLGTLQGEALADCLNRHQFLIVPSRWEEPFGLVALEGMACGCIPIVSDGGGLVEAVGQAGLTFSRGNVKSLVDCIKSLLLDQALQHRLREAASFHLATHKEGVVAKKYLLVLEQAFANFN